MSPVYFISSISPLCLWSVAPYIQSLPNEVLVQIFSYLREVDLVHLMLVCRRFNEIANLSSLWRTLFLRVFEIGTPYVIPKSMHSQTSSSSPPSTSLPHVHTHSRSSSPQHSRTLPLPTTELSWKERFSLMVGAIC